MPQTSEQKRNQTSKPTPNDQQKRLPVIGEAKRITTLGEMMSNSPVLDGQRWGQKTETVKRVPYLTSPDFNNVFYTPRMSFSSKLEKVDELSGDRQEAKQVFGRDEKEEEKKKVRFKLTEEPPADHVVLVYSPIRSGAICSKRF
ncbi:hypothetical protein F511_42082 [Dorcoceras hygrometricum]|uniref:Uncharacterized protein n=1 Tax=Dorcoceras hygrometricum TaxID=472368 RepID=A0A2Z7CSG8_9LAMI|nr:hypothetical protein F511_42082 [Dorcoceras hygrometricum]